MAYTYHAACVHLIFTHKTLQGNSTPATPKGRHKEGTLPHPFNRVMAILDLDEEILSTLPHTLSTQTFFPSQPFSSLLYSSYFMSLNPFPEHQHPTPP